MRKRCETLFLTAANKMVECSADQGIVAAAAFDAGIYAALHAYGPVQTLKWLEEAANFIDKLYETEGNA